VQRSSNRVRVTAQLIDARTDTHQWAERYDRDLADVFAIQSEIAKAIADQLEAKLSPQEKARVEENPPGTQKHTRFICGRTKSREIPTRFWRITKPLCSFTCRPSHSIRILR
jgi:adenylate cyclase